MQSECVLGIYGTSHFDYEVQRINSINIISHKEDIYVHLP